MPAVSLPDHSLVFPERVRAPVFIWRNHRGVALRTAPKLAAPALLPAGETEPVEARVQALPFGQVRDFSAEGAVPFQRKIFFAEPARVRTGTRPFFVEQIVVTRFEQQPVRSIHRLVILVRVLVSLRVGRVHVIQRDDVYYDILNNRPLTCYSLFYTWYI